MKHSKASKGIAEKALAAAIADGTRQLQAELAKANQRIVQLEGLLARIASTAKTGQPTMAVASPPPLPVQAEEPAEPLPPVPTVPLADDDDMGEGRWA